MKLKCILDVAQKVINWKKTKTETKINKTCKY